MPRTEQTTRTNAEAQLDDALSDSFPASDPLASSPRHAGKNDKKAPITGADAVKDSVKH